MNIRTETNYVFALPQRTGQYRIVREDTRTGYTYRVEAEFLWEGTVVSLMRSPSGTGSYILVDDGYKSGDKYSEKNWCLDRSFDRTNETPHAYCARMARPLEPEKIIATYPPVPDASALPEVQQLGRSVSVAKRQGVLPFLWEVVCDGRSN